MQACTVNLIQGASRHAHCVMETPCTCTVTAWKAFNLEAQRIGLEQEVLSLRKQLGESHQANRQLRWGPAASKWKTDVEVAHKCRDDGNRDRGKGYRGNRDGGKRDGGKRDGGKWDEVKRDGGERDGGKRVRWAAALDEPGTCRRGRQPARTTAGRAVGGHAAWAGRLRVRKGSQGHLD
eukprot:364247-Chlamydomonas_euryale.AAC.17